jgi:hypothetical protein
MLVESACTRATNTKINISTAVAHVVAPHGRGDLRLRLTITAGWAPRRSPAWHAHITTRGRPGLLLGNLDEQLACELDRTVRCMAVLDLIIPSCTFFSPERGAFIIHSEKYQLRDGAYDHIQ